MGIDEGNGNVGCGNGRLLWEETQDNLSVSAVLIWWMIRSPLYSKLLIHLDKLLNSRISLQTRLSRESML